MRIRRTMTIGSLASVSVLALTGCLGVTTDSTVAANGEIMSTTWTMTYDRNQPEPQEGVETSSTINGVEVDPNSLETFEDAILTEGDGASAAGERLFPRKENCEFSETEANFIATCKFVSTAKFPITFGDLQSALMVQDIKVILKGEEVGVEMTAATNLDSGMWVEALGFSSKNILRMPGDITLLSGPGITQLDDTTVEWNPFASDVSQGDVVVIASKTSEEDLYLPSGAIIIGIVSIAVLIFLGLMMYYQRTQPRVRDAEPAGAEFERYTVYEPNDAEAPLHDPVEAPAEEASAEEKPTASPLPADEAPSEASDQEGEDTK
jgi:hypothetical protein